MVMMGLLVEVGGGAGRSDSGRCEGVMVNQDRDDWKLDGTRVFQDPGWRLDGVQVFQDPGWRFRRKGVPGPGLEAGVPGPGLEAERDSGVPGP